MNKADMKVQEYLDRASKIRISTKLSKLISMDTLQITILEIARMIQTEEHRE